jgi:hypothetical protein
MQRPVVKGAIHRNPEEFSERGIGQCGSCLTKLGPNFPRNPRNM